MGRRVTLRDSAVDAIEYGSKNITGRVIVQTRCPRCRRIGVEEIHARIDDRAVCWTKCCRCRWSTEGAFQLELELGV